MRRGNAFDRTCVSVCLSVPCRTLTFESVDAGTSAEHASQGRVPGSWSQGQGRTYTVAGDSQTAILFYLNYLK